MSLIKRRPVLSMLLAAAALAVAAPAAYAIGHRILVSFDPAKPAPEIEHDIQNQLDTAGVKATVHAEKTDGKLRVSVHSHDPSAEIAFPQLGSAAQRGREVSVSLEADHDDDAAYAKLDEVLHTAPVAAALDGDDDPETAEEVITEALANAGFRAVEVEADEHAIRIHATAPAK